MPNQDTQTESSRILLIANPHSGTLRRQPELLNRAVSALRSWRYTPEVLALQAGSPLRQRVTQALEQGDRLFAVLGGDGTLSAVAGELAGTEAKLAILPAGNSNNVARCMGVPEDIDGAAALPRSGRLAAVDVGRVHCQGRGATFLELCMVGVIAKLSELGDDIRHGDLRHTGAFLKTLTSARPVRYTLKLDGGPPMTHMAHLAVVTNMPATGLHFQLAPYGCQTDGMLDVQTYAGLGKTRLLRYVAGGIYPGKPGDERIGRHQARHIHIESDPPQPVSVDGDIIGTGPCDIEVWPQALHLFVP